MKIAGLSVLLLVFAMLVVPVAAAGEEQNVTRVPTTVATPVPTTVPTTASTTAATTVPTTVPMTAPTTAATPVPTMEPVPEVGWLTILSSPSGADVTIDGRRPGSLPSTPGS